MSGIALLPGGARVLLPGGNDLLLPGGTGAPAFEEAPRGRLLARVVVLNMNTTPVPS